MKSSADTFLENLNIIMENNGLTNYQELSNFISINKSTVASWFTGQRTPSIQKLDIIANHLLIPTYLLIKPNLSLIKSYTTVENDSHRVLVENLNYIFHKLNKITYREKCSLFYNFISEDQLRNYLRESNWNLPNLNTLDNMASSLGKPNYLLLKRGGIQHEEDN